MKPLTIFFAGLLLLVVTAPLASAAPLTEAQAFELGVDAYVYGYPLVTMELTRRVSVNVRAPEGTRAPMGQFANLRTYPDAAFRAVTTPNADTLYSVAWIDLAKEPYVLSLPDMKGRYYLMPVLDAWTNVIAVPGSRTTGTGAQRIALTGPGWKGTLPKDVQELKAPTSLVWLLGRTYCTGTKEDYAAVHALQDQYRLSPLSHFGHESVAKEGTVDRKVDMKAAPREQVAAMPVDAYFTLLGKLMAANPATKEDAPMVAKLARLGIVPGTKFEPRKLGAAAARGLARVPKAATERILAGEKQAGALRNGWLVSLHLGSYGTDYGLRAYTAAVGLGANQPEDAVYPMTHVDADGAALDGANRYVLHFAADRVPPVQGFWSLTMYDPRMFFVANPLNKYAVGPRDELKLERDGSLDLLIQKDSPGVDREANWLPAPAGKFVLVLRMYWPKEPVRNGTWTLPAVEKRNGVGE